MSWRGALVAIQPAEDASVVAADEEDLVALQFQVAVQSAGQHIHSAMRTLKVSEEQGDGRVEFDFHDGYGWLRGCESETGGERVNLPAKPRVLSLSRKTCRLQILLKAMNTLQRYMHQF